MNYFINILYLIAPEEVPSPAAISFPNSLSVHWDPPLKPNGIITQYILYKDNTVVYQGNMTSFDITGKQDLKCMVSIAWMESVQSGSHMYWLDMWPLLIH